MVEAEERRAPRLRELDAEELGPKKKVKAPKTPKAKKPPKEKKLKETDIAANAVLEKKKAGVLKIGGLVSLLWLCMIGVFILLIRFDPTEGEIAGRVLLFFNPEEEVRENYYQSEIYDVQDRDYELTLFEQELEARETELEVRTDELDEREDIITEREDAILESQEQAEDPQSGSEVIPSRPEEMAKTLSKMSPAAAASVLMDLDSDKALVVCKYLTATRLAPIMEAMENDPRISIIEAFIPDPSDTDGYDSPVLPSQTPTPAPTAAPSVTGTITPTVAPTVTP